MKKKLLMLVSAVFLLCASAVPTLAQDSWQPYALTGGQAVGGTLAGDAAGSFNYYRVSYPGNSTDVRIQLSVSTYEVVRAGAVGFNVYSPNGRVDRGDWQADADCLEMTYQEEEAAELIVQVYNYGSSTIAYSITATGLPQTSVVAETIAPTTGSDVATMPDPAAMVGGQGALLGNTGGAVALYNLVYAGDESDRTVTLTYDPADPSFGSAFGLNIYAPDGSLVAQGHHTDLYHVIQATLNNDVAGNYTIQVFNYTDGIILYYTLEVVE